MELSAKKLSSGNYQVRFSLNGYYGYILVESVVPMESIVKDIIEHVEAMNCPERYFQKNLLSMAKPKLQNGKILVFRESAQAMAA
ncbi:MAG: hypothetical protein ACO3FI_06925 [Cyclobacteriaceae bacterium]